MQKSEFLVDEKLIFVELTEQDFKEFDVEEEDVHGLISQLFTLKTALGIALVTPRYGLKHVSLRSKQGVDVSIIANSYGGGGHICASAFNSELDSNQIKEDLIKQFGQQIKNYQEKPVDVF